MTPETWLQVAWVPAMTVLPARLYTPAACRLVLAICLHESGGLKHRRQVVRYERLPGIDDPVPLYGPARGWAQFEEIGVAEVLRHPASNLWAATAAAALGYDGAPVADIHAAVEHNDALAIAIARLALWRLPEALPTDEEEAWAQYVRIWAPGSVTEGGQRAEEARARWPVSWGRAVEVVERLPAELRGTPVAPPTDDDGGPW